MTIAGFEPLPPPVPTTPPAASLLARALDAAREALARGDHRAVADGLGAALAAPRAADDPAATQARLLVARAAFGLARFDDAAEAARRALDACRAQDDGEGALVALRLLAYALAEGQRPAEALAAAREAFAAAEGAGHTGEALQSMVLVGTLHGRLGEHDLGEGLLLQAVSRARDVGEPALVGHTLNALLALLLDAHEAQQAAGDTARAAATARRVGLHVGGLLHRIGGLPAVLQQAVCCSNAGAALHVCGRTDEAASMLGTALALCRAHGFALVGLRVLVRLARLRLDQRDLAAAAAALDELDGWLDSTPHDDARAEWLALSARLAAVQGDATAAAEVGALAARAAFDRQRRQAAAHGAAQGPDDGALPPRLDALEAQAGG